jgi:hypothetical protein
MVALSGQRPGGCKSIRWATPTADCLGHAPAVLRVGGPRLPPVVSDVLRTAETAEPVGHVPAVVGHSRTQPKRLGATPQQTGLLGDPTRCTRGPGVCLNEGRYKNLIRNKRVESKRRTDVTVLKLIMNGLPPDG